MQFKDLAIGEWFRFVEDESKTWFKTSTRGYKWVFAPKRKGRNTQQVKSINMEVIGSVVLRGYQAGEWRSIT